MALSLNMASQGILDLPDKLVPVFEGEADVRGAFGGRGSGKTRNFATMTAVRTHMWDRAGRTGIILCGRQYMNSLDDSSMEEIKEAIKAVDWLEPHFDIGEKYIRTKSGNIHYRFSGLDRNVASIKSKSRILLCWIDEAEPVTDDAYIKLIPTLREEDSELWVNWNPETERSATHRRFRLSKDPRYKIVEMNWRDNPWFPQKLMRDMERDKIERPEQVDHIWEGGFKVVVEGAYFTKQLLKAREQKRIGFFAEDPLMVKRAFFDIGGTGRRADATAIWIAQFIGSELRVLDYYEAERQPLATHLGWMRRRDYTPETTKIWLPHDGDHGDKVYATDYQSALQQAGYDVEVVPNQGPGAKMERVDAARRLFPRIRFNEETTQGGLKALAHYHEKIHPERLIGLGPEHDWSSHGADAFGLMCIVFEEEPVMRSLPQIGDRYQASV